MANTITAAVAAAMDSPKVRKALKAKADRMLPRTQRLAFDAGARELGNALRVEEGTRPGSMARDGLKRPYARVVAELTADQVKKDADAALTRRLIMRRGARV